ncbi:hypothetical protein ACLOJK_012162 [Asimina triloba]
MAQQQRKLQLIKGERHLFSASDDDAVMKQIAATHAPDGRDVDARPILRIVQDILHRATPAVLLSPTLAQLDISDEKGSHGALLGMLEAVAYIIHRISCEIKCRCTGGRSDPHATALALFNSLSSFSWDAKLVLALAAFAVSYGEFWLTAQQFSLNPLAKSVALLKQLPDILEQTNSLKPHFDAIDALIEEMLDVANSIIELKELPTDYITSDAPAMIMATSHIPTAAYWTVRGIIACMSQMIGLIGFGHEEIASTSGAWDLSSLAHKLSNISGHLRKQLGFCYQHIGQFAIQIFLGFQSFLLFIAWLILFSTFPVQCTNSCKLIFSADEEKRDIEAFQNLIRLFEMLQIDNMRILKALLHSKDDLPLVDGVTKQRVGVDVLRRKMVILLISDLGISLEELTILTNIYNATHHGKYGRQYEIVWLPIAEKGVQWTDENQKQFVYLASSMPWYTVNHPTMIQPHVVRYIKEVWNFSKKPLLVVLDAQGKVACPNALHMMWIWGNLAFPFTALREEALWNDETWKVEFLVDDIDPIIVQWAREEKYICLYGGEDIAWIKRFTSAMKKVIQETKIPIEMVYVGKSHPKERVRKIITTIDNEKLSGTWHDLVYIWFFWARLESIWYSKMQQGRTLDEDQIMQEVMTLLTYDGSNEGWATISRGSAEMVRAQGKTLVECLTEVDAWKGEVERVGLIPALTNALAPYHKHEHCVSLILPGIDGKIQERVVCAECRRPMEKFILYRCCND